MAELDWSHWPHHGMEEVHYRTSWGTRGQLESGTVKLVAGQFRKKWLEISNEVDKFARVTHAHTFSKKANTVSNKQ